MRAAFVIAAKDLRQKIRDRSAIIISVLAPFVLAALFSMMIPSQDTFHATYASWTSTAVRSAGRWWTVRWRASRGPRWPRSAASRPRTRPARRLTQARPTPRW